MLVEKVFDNKKIRTIWNSEEEKFYISVIDMIEVLTDSVEPRKYWNWLKNKMLKEEQFETSSITRQLKLVAKDGKHRMTDVVDIEGNVAKNAKEQIEKETGKKIVTSSNNKNIKRLGKS